MARLVRLQDIGGDPFYVNPEEVTLVRSNDDSETEIVVEGDVYLLLTGVEEVADLINTAR